MLERIRHTIGADGAAKGRRAPARTGRRARDEPHPREAYDRLLARAKALPAVTTAVAHPCDVSSLTGAVDAARMGLIAPILVGPAQRIRAVAKQAGLDISAYEIVDAPHSHASAAEAVRLVREGRAECLMKGSLHTDEADGARWWRATAGCAPRAASATAS